VVTAAKADKRRPAVGRPPRRKEAVREPNTPVASRMWFLTDWQRESENWYEQSPTTGWSNKNNAKAR
jgi:hypothetical protein